VSALVVLDAFSDNQRLMSKEGVEVERLKDQDNLG